MADREQTRSECTDESKVFGFKCPCCDPEVMSKMARVIPFLFVAVGAGLLVRSLIKKKRS